MALNMKGVNVLGKTHFGPNITNPYLSYMVLNLEGQGTNGSTSIIDSTSRHAITANGTAQISTSQYIVGTSSISMVPNGYLTTPYSSDFTFTGDFSIESWIYMNTGSSTSGLMGSFNFSPLGGWRVLFSPSGFTLNVGSTYMATTVTTVPLQTWNHWAVVRHGSTITFYYNGVASGTSTYSGTISNPYGNTFYLGINADQSSGITYPMNGYLNQTRIYNGAAVYTSNFTPSTSPSGI